MFRELQRGQFVALGPALSRRPLPIRVGGVETAPRIGIPTLMPLPGQANGEARDLILAPVRVGPARPPAERRPATAPPSMNQILEEIVRNRPAAASTDDTPALAPAERERALRAIAGDIMADPEAAFRPEPVLYGDFQVRCRIGKLGGGPVPLAEFKLHLAAARAGLDPETTDGGDWDRALEVARIIPDDLQAAYLILAAAALRGAPCPSDAEVARRCGMHSPGRARTRIGHLDRSDLIVTRSDMSGHRVVVLPDLGWETAPGDPNAPATLVDALPRASAAKDLFAAG